MIADAGTLPISVAPARKEPLFIFHAWQEFRQIARLMVNIELGEDDLLHPQAASTRTTGKEKHDRVAADAGVLERPAHSPFCLPATLSNEIVDSRPTNPDNPITPLLTSRVVAGIKAGLVL